MVTKKQFLISLMTALLAAVILIRPVFAHGETEVGDYAIEIGFHNEPALLGQPNGLDLFVTNSKTGEQVNGLEETLQVEIIFGSSKKELEIRPQFGQDGAYTADVIPTQVGDYTWHIFGEINGTPVDISMTSGPDTFGSVEDTAVLAFPDPAGSGSPVGGDLARTALWVAIGGVVLGLAGLLVGLAGLRSGRSRS